MASLRALAVISSFVFLAACASSPGYAPAQREGGAGYSETRIEADRYRIVYRGARNAEQASDFALLRAADLALQNGYDWFVVDRRFGEGQREGSKPRVSIGLGTSRFGGNTSVAGVGFGVGSGGGSASETLEVRFGSGPKPTEGQVYDARDVRQSIGARLGS